MNLIHYRYDDNIYKFIAGPVVSCLRNTTTHAEQTSGLSPCCDEGRLWASLFTGKLGIIAVGGHTARMRGIHQGAVS